MNSTTDVVIYETTNYDQFELFRENRPITNCMLLREVIKKNNKLMYNPIIVNSNLEVIDGQHRLSIAKQLNIPIYFVIDHSGTVDDIKDLNIGRKNWSLLEYITFYSCRGNKVYEFLQKALDQFDVCCSVLARNITTCEGKSVTESIKKEKLTFKYNEIECLKYLDYYQDIINKFDIYKPSKVLKSQAYEAAVFSLVRQENYNHKRMLKRIDEHPDYLITANQFRQQALISEILIEKLHNYKLIEKNRI